MASTPTKINQDKSMPGDSCDFIFTENVGVPLMATLNLPGFALGIPVWWFPTPTILNVPSASQVSTLYQGHQNNVSLSPIVSSTPPSTSCGESTDTSNRQSKRSKRRRNRKKAHKQMI